MLSVALLISFVWSLGYGDINFRSFREKINWKICYCSTPLQCSDATVPMVAFYIPLLRPLIAVHIQEKKGREGRRERKREGRRWEKLGFSPNVVFIPHPKSSG